MQEKREPNVSGSTLRARHIAETEKFRAETAAMLAEAAVARQEADKFRYEAANLRVDYEDSLYIKNYNDNIDSHHRTYNMVGVIDEDTIEDLVTHVNSWARTSNQPIIIRLNSPGGEVFAGLALFDQLKAIDQYKAPVHTVALGMTASMAGIIFQAGRKRIISPNATFLIHEVSVEIPGGVTRSQIEDINKSVQAMNNRLYKILSVRSTMSVEEIEERAKRKDWEVDADEAVKLGLADEVGYV